PTRWPAGIAWTPLSAPCSRFLPDPPHPRTPRSHASDGVITRGVIRPQQSRENCFMTLLCDETKLYRTSIPAYGGRVSRQAARAAAEDRWSSARKSFL